MKKFKEGDKVRIKGTFVNGKIVTNHCNGYYDIQFRDSIFRTDIHISELTDPTYKVIKVYIKSILIFRLNIELFIIRNAKFINFIISILFIFAILEGIFYFVLYVVKQIFIGF